jgi:hypothetical protein
MPEEMLTYSWFAEAYDWTPEDVDRLSQAQEYWLPVIAEAKSRVQEMRSREERNSQ